MFCYVFVTCICIPFLHFNVNTYFTERSAILHRIITHRYQHLIRYGLRACTCIRHFIWIFTPFFVFLCCFTNIDMKTYGKVYASCRYRLQHNHTLLYSYTRTKDMHYGVRLMVYMIVFLRLQDLNNVRKGNTENYF